MALARQVGGNRQADAANAAPVLLSDPLVLRYKDDPRFARLRRELGLQAPG